MTNPRTAAMMTTATALSMLILATGCASGPKSYGTVDDLKTAYTDAGGDCTTFEPGTASGEWAQYGNCTPEGAVLSTYSSDDDLNSTLASLKDGTSPNPRAFVGPNWIISTDAPEDVGTKLDATIVNLTTE